MLPVLALILSAIEPSFAQTTSYYAVQNSIWDQCGKSASKNTSDFGCGTGLDCQYQNPWYSQCIPNKAFNMTAWTQCPTSERNWSGNGTCVEGTYCHYDNEWYAQCKPCRTKRVTCGPSAFYLNDIGCCPGRLSESERLFFIII
jgi:hypothetical protein